MALSFLSYYGYGVLDLITGDSPLARANRLCRVLDAKNKRLRASLHNAQTGIQALNRKLHEAILMGNDALINHIAEEIDDQRRMYSAIRIAHARTYTVILNIKKAFSQQSLALNMKEAHSVMKEVNDMIERSGVVQSMDDLGTEAERNKALQYEMDKATERMTTGESEETDASNTTTRSRKEAIASIIREATFANGMVVASATKKGENKEECKEQIDLEKRLAQLHEHIFEAPSSASSQ
jgi:hypothetical protein